LNVLASLGVRRNFPRRLTYFLFIEKRCAARTFADCHVGVAVDVPYLY